MPATFQVFALSSLDPAGTDNRNEPLLLYPDALKAAEELNAEGKAFRVVSRDEPSPEQMQAFIDLGAVT